MLDLSQSRRCKTKRLIPIFSIYSVWSYICNTRVYSKMCTVFIRKKRLSSFSLFHFHYSAKLWSSRFFERGTFPFQKILRLSFGIFTALFDFSRHQTRLFLPMIYQVFCPKIAAPRRKKRERVSLE